MRGSQCVRGRFGYLTRNIDDCAHNQGEFIHELLKFQNARREA